MKFCLGTGDLLSLAGGANGIVLHCQRGTLWLTKGDGVDYLVHEGGSFNLLPGSAAVVEALGSAEFRVVTAGNEAAGAPSALALKACRAFS